MLPILSGSVFMYNIGVMLDRGWICTSWEGGGNGLHCSCKRASQSTTTVRSNSNGERF